MARLLSTGISYKEIDTDYFSGTLDPEVLQNAKLLLRGERQHGITLDDLNFYPIQLDIANALTNNRDPYAPEQSMDEIIDEMIHVGRVRSVLSMETTSPYDHNPPAEPLLNRKQRRAKASKERRQ